MNFIDYELIEVSKLCHNVIPHSKLVTCQPSIVRVDIQHTVSLQLSARFRFAEHYPKEQPLLVELKSKTLCARLLDGLTQLCEQRAKAILGKAQIIEVLKCIHKYLTDNPLCIVYAEVANIRRLLCNDDSKPAEGRDAERDDRGGGELKLRQKQSVVALVARGGPYEFRVKVHVPADYPLSCVSWSEHASNLPVILQRFLNGQAREIARQCVEPPLRPAAPTAPPFQPSASLEVTLGFLVAATRDFHAERCPVCELPCLPADAADVVLDDTADAYVERVLCGHLFHQGCLKRYMGEPPFPAGGKCCPAEQRHPRADRGRAAVMAAAVATASRSALRRQRKSGETCGMRLSHDRWGLSVQLAEARWAQQQARERELAEVCEFLQ